MIIKPRPAIQRMLQKLIQIVVLVVTWGIAWIGLLLPLSRGSQVALFVLAGFASLMLILTYAVLIPRFGTKRWINHMSMFVTIVVITIYVYLLEPIDTHLDVLFIAVIAGSGLLTGKRSANLALLLSLVATLILMGLHQLIVGGTLAALVLEVMVFFIAGYVISSLVGFYQESVQLTDRQNRRLSLMLDINTLIAGSQDLRHTISEIAESIAKTLPVTTCRISLVDTKTNQLVTYGAYPLREMLGWEPLVGVSLAVDKIPLVNKALQSSQPVIARVNGWNEWDSEITDPLGFKEANSICVVPLYTSDGNLGIIAVTEARNWDREPFDKDKVDLLRTLAAQTSVLIRDQQMYRDSLKQAERQKVLNEVARAIGSTIKLTDLLELIYEQLYRVIPSDTYFVALYNEERDTLNYRVVIDDGERFPETNIPVGRGLSSWVINNKEPLLVRALSEEMDSLPVKPTVLGKSQMSESWLGVPMLSGERCLGLLAIASYAPNSFDEDDQELLNSVAVQAALAVDNANMYASVEEQARRDALTGAYNHGYLLFKIQEHVKSARAKALPVSLIMLDIDYFKEYNDRFGHVVGDEVLQVVVQAIRSHIKQEDIVGRWGGEEFGVLLPGAGPDQALQVADRIRATLAAIKLTDREGRVVHTPTVSQGIASFPQHVDTHDLLVDVADKELYYAKEQGRDQIRVAK